MVPLVVHIMVQIMILDIHHSLTIMDLDQDEVVTQEAHQEILHSLMDLMALHTAILMGLHMALQLALHMALHMVHLMVILVILEVPTMATGKMAQEDKEIMDMAIEGKTIKVVRRTSEEEGVTLSRTGKKIHAEGIRIEQNL
eukprot:GFUD01093518.1.p3 GENE.GFUD01093518.1~~GFUD01093518.1.p3  ORF type:complete len:142 (-),score=35.67 GFUD01093518.1:83-508(-)